MLQLVPANHLASDYTPSPNLPTPARPTAVEALGERIALLSAQIAAATWELLVMLREFDQKGGWDCGFRSCAHWLTWRTGIELGAAREKVRVAHALAELPALSNAMQRGALSYSKVRALTRIATPVNESELLHFATAGSASHVEKLVRAYRRADRLAEGAAETARFEGRYFRSYTDEDGSLVLQARLTPEAGAALLRALDAAGQKLYGESRPDRRARPDAAGETTADQRRADALALVAESALAGGLDPGTRGDRYQVVVHVDADALRAESGVATENVSAETSAPPVGGCSTLDGRHVSAETSRRLACDCARVTMLHDRDGNVLDVGRRTRAIPPALRRALERRDGGCRFPGCGLALCDAHHVDHWADGGATKLGNLVQLCRFHHRAVHEGGFTVELLAGGEVRFRRPDGRYLEQAPALPTLAATGRTALAPRSARVSAPVAPSWERGPVDYDWSIQWLHHLEGASSAGDGETAGGSNARH